MDVRKVFPSSLYRSKSKRDQLVCASPTSPPPMQDAASPKAHKPTMPIAIPRRKTVCPPPCSPIRQQGSPDIVFNFDFSFSPCSFQGHGQILTRKDDWAPQFLQQRGRTNLVLAHQCHQQQKTLCGLTRRNSSARRRAEALYRNQPMRGLLAQALRTHERAYSHGPGYDLEAEPEEECALRDSGIGEPDGLAPAYASPVSSECSSIVFASPPRDAHSSDRRRRLQDEDEFADPGLTSAFQRSVTGTSASGSAQTASPVSSPFELPFSPPNVSALPSPPATSRTTSVTSSPSSRVPLHPIFPHNRSSTHLLRTSAAAPVVCLNVAEAERPDRPRARSPYPDGRVYRGRRSSSAGSRPTVMTLGRTQSSLVLSNEELERSLEKDASTERGRGPERGTQGRELDEKEMVRGWEMEYERGRTRGRTRGRGIAVARAPPVHM